MKLSIVIICWNDAKVILNCLASIFAETAAFDLEVIVSDNGSTDESVRRIRESFPAVRVLENGANLGFAKANNAGIRVAQGAYVLILNPDTIIHDRALEKLVSYADAHPEAGAFGCRVLNPDGSFQNPARPIPTALGYLVAALCLRGLGKLARCFESDVYCGWDGRTERAIGFQSGCCVLFRRRLLRQLDGFDERFFFQYEDADLCRRVWDSGAKVLFYPGAEITHIGGQNRGQYTAPVVLETYRSLYRYFYKHDGSRGVVRLRRIVLLHLWIRRIGYSLLRLVRPGAPLDHRIQSYESAIRWNVRLNPLRFVRTGEEPGAGRRPPAPASKMDEEPA